MFIPQQILYEIMLQFGSQLSQHPDCLKALIYQHCSKSQLPNDLLRSIDLGIPQQVFQFSKHILQKIPGLRILARQLFMRRLIWQFKGQFKSDVVQLVSIIKIWEQVIYEQPETPLPTAYFYLGWIYHVGEGVPQNFDQAAYWYRRAPKQEGLAQLNLAKLYQPRKLLNQLVNQYSQQVLEAPETLEELFLQCCPYEYERTLLLLPLRTEQSFQVTVPGRHWQIPLVSLGLSAAQADWVIQSWCLILERYTPCCSPAEACFELGQWYIKVQNWRQTYDWYQKAAVQQHKLALFNLGVLCSQGYGLEVPDFKQAFEWFEQAAQQHDVIAQCVVGIFYEHGIGVAENSQQAGYWFELAAQQGSPLAATRLQVLSS